MQYDSSELLCGSLSNFKQFLNNFVYLNCVEITVIFKIELPIDKYIKVIIRIVNYLKVSPCHGFGNRPNPRQHEFADG